MRLSEAKIKEAILHPDRLARQAAVTYFSEAYSRDTEVMPLAVQAVEKYGRDNAFRTLGDLVIEATPAPFFFQDFKGGAARTASLSPNQRENPFFACRLPP